MPRFLIIRFSSIGDIVLTTPVIRAIKTQIPGSEVAFITKPQFASILAGNPYIDKLMVLKEKLSETIAEIKNEEFDYIIDLHNNQRTWNIKRQLKIQSIAFKKLNWEKWLLVNFKVNKLPNVHIVDRYLDTVKPFGVVDDGEGLDFFIPDELANYPQEVLPDFNNGYICAVLGANHATKQIPVKKLLAVLNTSQKPVCLIGGKDVSNAADELASHLIVPCVNLVGKISLHQSAAIIRESRVIITPDTGMMHIASALHKNVISIWGNTVPELGMYPYRPGCQSKIFEVKGLSCRPCSKLGFKRCPRGHFNCMQQIDPAIVSAYIQEIF
jgi:ADP-heptose:LPS heptosyltransferase